VANLGPLRRLAGSWEGPKGHDINPKAEGPEHRDYIERMLFEPIDPQANGPQLFYGLRYHIHINTPEEDITFHDQVGHWLWEPATGLVLQTLSIPRGQTALASGRAAPGDDRIVVAAERGNTENGICSTAFYGSLSIICLSHRPLPARGDLQSRRDVELRQRYHPDRSRPVRPFTHRDRNTLTKVAEPAPNPLMRIIAAREVATVK